MTCAESEERAVRSPEDGTDCALERHLAECAACHNFANGLAETRAALRDLRDEPLDPAEYVRLRQSVMRRIAEEPRRLPWWPHAVAAGLLVMLALGYLYREPGKPVGDPPVLLARVHEPPPMLSAMPPAVPAPPAPVRVRSRHRRKSVEKSDPLVVKFETADPDVTIIWLIEKKGD